ncbi:MAG: molybdopterin molybdotransferase MoeA, partial [Lachnospiraceae bacterium]
MDGLLLNDALNLLLERVEKIEESETVSLWDVSGRVLAEDVVAKRNQPPFDRSPLDGYAVRSEDLTGASREHPVSLTVIDEVDAGHVTEKIVESGMAVRIMTGAPIPEGADCVVGQEDTDYGEDRVEIYEEIQHHQNYCFEGEDYQAGAVLLKKGTAIGAVEAGVLASLGLESVKAYRLPKISVITTGDEIVLPGEELLPGKIYDSNLYTLVTRLKSWGIVISEKGRAEDDAQTVADRIKEAFKHSDLIVT